MPVKLDVPDPIGYANRQYPLNYDRSHSHSLDDIVGYRVVRSYSDGKSTPRLGSVPIILGLFERYRYLDALALAKENRRAYYRTAPKGRRVLSESPSDIKTIIANPHYEYVKLLDYACVDCVYKCGCVDGDYDYMPNTPGVIGPMPSVTHYDPATDKESADA